MNKQELIEKLEERKTIIGNFQGYAVWWEDIKEIFEELDKPSSGHADEAPRYVKNVLARLRELPLHDREVWLKAIMSEFERDFSHAIWREGYKQGKFEGEWVGQQLKDADKIRCELNRVKIPEFAANVIEGARGNSAELEDALFYAHEHGNQEFKNWYRKLENRENFARAFLNGYDIKQEKRYLVTLKNGQPLVKSQLGNTLYFNQNITAGNYKASRKELEEAGFGWVFDCPGIEIEEVL